MTRKCAEPDCQRKPIPGWARCHEHFAEWLRLLGVEVEDRKRLADWAPGELVEVYGR